MKKEIKHSEAAQDMLNNIPRRVSFACPLIVIINIVVIIIFTKSIVYPTIVSIPFNAENSYVARHNSDDVLFIYMERNIEEDGIKEQNEVNLRFNSMTPKEKGVIQGKIMKINSEDNGYKIMIHLSSWPYTTYNYSVDKEIIPEGFCDIITMNTTFFAKLPQLFNLKRLKQ